MKYSGNHKVVQVWLIVPLIMILSMFFNYYYLFIFPFFEDLYLAIKEVMVRNFNSASLGCIL